MDNELDLTELEADLYRAWQQMQRGNYGSAENKVAKSWATIHQFQMGLDQRHLKSTHDTGLRPTVIRILYAILNRGVRCGNDCEWMYPYGWVPAGGCPKHD